MLLSLLSLFLPSNRYARARISEKPFYTCTVLLSNSEDLGGTEMNTYVIGTTIRMQATFVDEVGGQIIPPTVNVKVKSPDGTITSDVAMNIGSGVFVFNFITAVAGTHYYRFDSINTYVVAQEGTFQVKKSGVL